MMADGLEEVQHQTQQTQLNLSLLAQQLADIRADLREVRNQVSSMNRPDRATLISLGLFIILCGGGLWGLAIKPVNDQLVAFATKEQLDYKFNGLTKDQIIAAEHMKELENKFATKDQLDQLKFEVQKRLVK